MSPELERLLQSLFDWENSVGEQRARLHAEFERLLAEVLQSNPHLNAASLRKAIKERYYHYRKAQIKTLTIPPKA